MVKKEFNFFALDLFENYPSLFHNFYKNELLANVDLTFNVKQIPDLKEMLTLE